MSIATGTILLLTLAKLLGLVKLTNVLAIIWHT